jgi:hypothetical protein
VPRIVGNGNAKNKHRRINIWGVSEATCIAISVPITPRYSQQIICLLGEDAHSAIIFAIKLPRCWLRKLFSNELLCTRLHRYRSRAAKKPYNVCSPVYMHLQTFFLVYLFSSREGAEKRPIALLFYIHALWPRRWKIAASFCSQPSKAHSHTRD